ncbi:RNA-directed DNA polymerase [uncultured Dysosmobacter sp.]|uniref:RNA-directed DNA polymerase n=1 Tax=uncultured Dysosmobacter sp. TaxID=2591384 RepID=UPI0026196D51|nr:RNA-directed DNA polymerase [uncultured Dysosmobacter sp.]
MKTIKHIKEQVTDYDNLYKAYLHARRNKRFRDEVLEFSANLEDYLHWIQEGLIDQTYVPGRYFRRVIHDPVERLIMWQAFIHRVVQWAVYQIINPGFVRSYIEDSYACIKGRGSDAAAQRLFYFMQQAGRAEKSAGRDENGRLRRRFYLEKLDTSKYFYRIDHQVSLDLVGRKCGYDPWLMWLMDLFVNAPGEKFGFPPGKGVGDVSPEEMLEDKGLAVGSLLNQMLANVNQNEVDHFAKRTLRIHYYVRYMDDIVILSDSKDQLVEWRQRIEEFMEDRLKLELNPKKSFIQPINQGIDFCQYRVFPDHIRLKKSTALRMKKRLKKIQQLYADGEITLERAQMTVNSYLGLLSHCDSYQLRKAIFGEYSDTEWTEGWFVLRRNSDKNNGNDG